MPRLYFEDFQAGATATYGAHVMTREEIVSFAAQFDPQPMHLDEAAGAGSMLGGLGASGWHTCSVLMRLLADNVLNQAASMGSPGIDSVRWLKPVRPGDVLRVRQTVLEARASRSKPDRGFVRFRFEVLNQDGAVVLEQVNSIMFARREPGETG